MPQELAFIIGQVLGIIAVILGFPFLPDRRTARPTELRGRDGGSILS